MNEHQIDMLRKIIRYNPDTERLEWAQRDRSCYPDVEEAIATRRAAAFNRKYAGNAITIRKNKRGSRYAYLRFIHPTANISADRLLWLAISGELTDDVLWYADGNEYNTALDNIYLTHIMAKPSLVDMGAGITSYEVQGEPRWRATIYKNLTTPRMTKSGFRSFAAAYQWRIDQLKAYGVYWQEPATEAYEVNLYK